MLQYIALMFEINHPMPAEKSISAENFHFQWALLHSTITQAMKLFDTFWVEVKTTMR